ncbi:MAG: FAD-binding protein [Sulfuricaulis sp.]|uniref:FAD-binding oxidoreductase n=1 Tax=Sulfuricaulis sp. TaxID=2003553 RepID=UPI0025FCA5A2|nr:FAD-linked oxidase C-terminal domain-containing protein [Sulfuricaulis sp.]MCR4347586.1 FAD-binding protein [Sulfuricaulis sp.]
MTEIPGPFVERLKAVLGAQNVLTDPADRWPYGQDNSRKHTPPDAVAFATTHAQVLETVRLCHQYSIPIVARGRGTGTTGSAIPVRGGLVLSLERMNRIVEMDAANRVMRVEPGVINQAIQDKAAPHGFFWPPDPTSSAYCTVGGNIALNAAGPRALKYGTTRENVLGLVAVTGKGDEIHTGTYTTKGVVGYDLTRLIIGSEGTLAIVTEATLKLTPLPESRRTLQAVYASVRTAAAAISRLMSQSVTPCALEFMDAAAIEMIRNYSQAELPRGAGALLMIELDGPEAAMETAVATVSAAARGDGLLNLNAAGTRDEAAALWATRKALSPALRNIAPNKLNEDVVVPVSRIPELIDGLEKLSREFGIPIVNFGHAGNGNIHVNLLYDTQDPQQDNNARPCLSRVFDLVLQLGGTLSGEHGIGVEKRDYINRAIDPVTLDLMRSIKRQFDPRGILNPDKIFPSQ